MTAAEVLRENGYYTFHSGKWHLGGMREEFRVDRVRSSSCGIPGPNQHGFEEYISELDGPESPRYTYQLPTGSLHSKGHRTLYRDDIPVPKEKGNKGFFTPYSKNLSYAFPPIDGNMKAHEPLLSRYGEGVDECKPEHQYTLSDREAMDALEFIRRHHKNQPDQPWFAQVWFNAPHGPWERLYAGEELYNAEYKKSHDYWTNMKCTWAGKDSV